MYPVLAGEWAARLEVQICEIMQACSLKIFWSCCTHCFAGKADILMKSELPLIIEFANSIGRDPSMDEVVVRNCVFLLGDICTTVSNVGPLLQQARSQDWEKLLNYCHDSESIAPDTDWAVQAVTTAVQSAG
jgi:hypothetical protein